MFVAIGSKVVRNLLGILLVEWQNTESSEEALPHLEDVQVVPAVEAAEQDLADLVEEGSLHSQRLCFVALPLTCLREEREDAIALRCVVGLLAKLLQALGRRLLPPKSGSCADKLMVGRSEVRDLAFLCATLATRPGGNGKQEQKNASIASMPSQGAFDP